jgi:hypothetical protein
LLQVWDAAISVFSHLNDFGIFVDCTKVCFSGCDPLHFMCWVGFAFRQRIALYALKAASGAFLLSVFAHRSFKQPPAVQPPNSAWFTESQGTAISIRCTDHGTSSMSRKALFRLIFCVLCYLVHAFA